MTKSRNILSPRRFWTEPELELLRANYAETRCEDLAFVLGRPARAVYQKARDLGLRKSREIIVQMARERTTADHPSAAHRFQPGQAAWNKGVKGVVGVQEACRATQFKPGQRPHTWVPVGSTRIVEGQLQRKLNDLPGPNHVRWFPVSRLVWEAANGPVPAGHLVVFKPGRATTVEADITLDAVECISRGEHARRNSIHNLPPELADVARLRGRIKRAINTREKESA